jgi:hypothetical protein
MSGLLYSLRVHPSAPSAAAIQNVGARAALNHNEFAVPTALSTGMASRASRNKMALRDGKFVAPMQTVTARMSPTVTSNGNIVTRDSSCDRFEP